MMSKERAILDVRAVCHCASFTMEELERGLLLHGHHVYKEIWKAAVCKVLSCEREPHNAHDRYAVAVKMTGTTDIVAWTLANIVGHCLWVNYS